MDKAKDKTYVKLYQPSPLVYKRGPVGGMIRTMHEVYGREKRRNTMPVRHYRHLARSQISQRRRQPSKWT